MFLAAFSLYADVTLDTPLFRRNATLKPENMFVISRHTQTKPRRALCKADFVIDSEKRKLAEVRDMFAGKRLFMQRSTGAELRTYPLPRSNSAQTFQDSEG